MKHTDCLILVARNRTRKQYKAYAHEATLDYLNSISALIDCSRSEVAETIHLCFLEKIGKYISYVDERTKLRMFKLRRAIAHNL